MGAKKELKQLNEDLDQSFGEVQNGFNHVNSRIDAWARQHREFRNEFNELREELATNGVIRDIRKLEKAHAAFERQTLAFMDSVDARFQELGTNGMATQVNNLTKEVFYARKDAKASSVERVMYAMAGVDLGEEPTLAGKVDAIMTHLGLDVTVKPQQVIEAKLEVKKTAPAKKKGRR